VGVAAKETQQLTPQQLTQRSWPQFTIVCRGGSGAGQGGSGAAAAAVVQRQRQWRSGGDSGTAAAAVAQRREALAQRRWHWLSGGGRRRDWQSDGGTGVGAAAEAVAQRVAESSGKRKLVKAVYHVIAFKVTYK
jgi:hypothetical protein